LAYIRPAKVVFYPFNTQLMKLQKEITMSRRKKFSGTQFKSLRKEAGYTQCELAVRLGISRETVSAIENEKPETMNVIGVEVISKWWSVCRQKASPQTQDSFFSTVMEYFDFNHR
jgi:HTH-type transcriptional regulator/antitoxin HipB